MLWDTSRTCRHCLERAGGVGLFEAVRRDGPGYAGALCGVDAISLESTVCDIEFDCVPGVTAWCPVCHVVGIAVEGLGPVSGPAVVEHVARLARLRRMYRVLPR